MYLRLLALSACGLLGSLPAQGYNCVLLGHQDLHPPYANIHGYVAPNGREYALLGARSGTAIVDCTDPANPVERGFIPGANSQWRELQTYQQYCYVVTEAAGGFQVISLQNPDAPVLVRTVGASYFNNCHTITVDLGTGRVYCNGTNAGTVVFDASVDPSNPTFVGYATTSGQSNYLHDLHVSNGFGYASMIYNGQLRIWDVTTFPPTTLSNVTTPSSFTHNAWPNANHTIVATTDERVGSVVKFYDITNKSNPVPLGQYTVNPATIPHNAYIIGNLCHVSWYTEGYVCIDFTDPNNPIRVAQYDTSAYTGGTFNGCWGVYPFQPSGNIYLMDIETGLYIVRNQITDLAVAHTPLGNVQDETGPYQVRATVTGSNPLSGVQLQWRVGDSGPFTSVAMTPSGNPNEYIGSIPGQLAPVFVQYHITASDPVGSRRSPVTGEHSFAVGTMTQVWFDDIETNRGWTTGITSGTVNDWQRGSPAGRTGTGWSDPASAWSGTTVWGTDLGNTIGTTSFNGAYYANMNAWLQSPAIPTNGVQGIKLRFRRWLTVHSGDNARLLVNGTQLFQSSGTSVVDTSWELVEYDVGSILDNASTATIRFELISNGTTNYGGWNIDDVELYNFSDCMPPRFYGAGTAGTGSQVPTVALNGVQRIGSSFQVAGSNLLGGSGAFLGLGLAPASLPVYGITGLIDPASAEFLFALTSGSGAGAGAAAWPFALPNNPRLDNMDLYSQVLVLDAGSPGGLLSASNGMQFRICRF